MRVWWGWLRLGRLTGAQAQLRFRVDDHLPGGIVDPIAGMVTAAVSLRRQQGVEDSWLAQHHLAQQDGGPQIALLRAFDRDRGEAWRVRDFPTC